MASESSSAVLELNDADTEDTEAPSVTDDAHEGAPLIMEHGYDIAIKVDAPLKQLSTLETFVTYRVRCVCARWPAPPYVRRRYNHFKVLHKRLSAAHAWTAVPPLPPLHSARQQLDRYSPGFVASRTLALNAFLDRVAKHPILTHSEDFRLFLTTPDEELEKVFKSENSALNLWGLSSALYASSSETKPANGPRVKDPEFTAASDYLQSLQQKLSTLCTLTTKLYKGSSSLGTELMGMKRACDSWGAQAGGRCGRAALACGAGAAAAAGGYARLRPPLRARATLPLLAAYAGAHLEKIRQRDAIHAAHVAGNSADSLHNRLSVATEAIRCELQDWAPKTRAELGAVLLDIADKQVTTLTQVLMGWEHALKLSTEANLDELFKTVSKTAVQNLSPSKCKSDVTPTETERDFDDIDNLSDSDIQEIRQDKELDSKVDFAEVNSEIGIEVVRDFRDENGDLSKQVNKIIDKIDLEETKKENGVLIHSNDSNIKSEKVVSDPLSEKLVSDTLTEKLVPDTLSEKLVSDPLQNFSDVDLSS